MRRNILIASALLSLAVATTLGASQAQAGDRLWTGVAIGAGTGAIVAGPPGAVIGGVIGGMVGGPSVRRGGRYCWNDRRGQRHCRS